MNPSEVAELAAYPTPTVGDSRNSRNATANRSTTGHNDGVTLCDLATWATLTAGLGKGGEPQDSKGKRDLRLDVAAATGVANSRSSPMERPGVLNPLLSLWLQGYPPEWLRVYLSSQGYLEKWLRSEARETR